MEKEDFNVLTWLFFIWEFLRIGRCAADLTYSLSDPVSLILNLVDLFLHCATFLLLCRRNKAFRVFFFLQMMLLAVANFLVIIIYSGDDSAVMSYLITISMHVAWFVYFMKSKYINRIISKHNKQAAIPMSVSEPVQEIPQVESSHPAPCPSQQSTALHSVATPELQQPCLAATPVRTQSNASPDSEGNATSKRYCKLCGAPLNNDRKCTGCGKQYFHIKKDAWLKFYAFCITLVLVVFVYQNYRNVKRSNDWMELYHSANTIKLELEPKVKDLEKLCRELESENDRLSSQKTLIQGKLNYYEKNAVFVTESGTKYHKADCYHIYGKSHWIYNVEAAKWRGYTACADCWK